MSIAKKSSWLREFCASFAHFIFSLFLQPKSFPSFQNTHKSLRARCVDSSRDAKRATRAMASRVGWTRDASGRMKRNEDLATASPRQQTDQCLLLCLPSHVLREVFGFLGARDVARAATTCSTFRQVSRSESLWRGFLSQKLGTQAEIVLPDTLPDERYPHGENHEEPAWKEMFKFWMNPQPNSLAWMESARGEDLESTGKFAARYLHRCTAIGDGNKILLFGGQGSGADFFNDLHLLDLKKAPLNLQQLSAAGDPPFPRCSGTLTAVSVSGQPGTEVVALFGGSQGFFEGFSNSLCILQGDNSVSISNAASQHMGLTWREPVVLAANVSDGVPDARWGHSAVSWRGKLILFGGSNTQHCFSDTWILDVSVNPSDKSSKSQLQATWKKLKLGSAVRPPSRAGQTVSLVGESLYVFGGCHISDVFNDLWKLDLSVEPPCWEELHVVGTPPAPRVGHAAVVLGDRIVFSGGRGSPAAGSSGTYATADQGLATMQGLTFFEGGFAMLDISRGRWMPIQHPNRSVYLRNKDDDDVDMEPEGVWEHRTGHVMVPAKDGLLVIGGLAYNGEFQNDVQHIKVF